MDSENSESLPDDELETAVVPVDEAVEHIDLPMEQPESNDSSLPEAIYLLLAGAAVEIGGLTREWLLGEQSANHQPSELTRGLIGAGLGAVKTAVSLTQWGLNVARFGGKVAWLMLPNPIAMRLEQQRTRWVAAGTEAMPAATADVQRITAVVMDNIVELVAASPAVQTLVQEQVDLALPHLLQNGAVDALVEEQVTQQVARLQTEPAVQTLVREQAGQYLDYLELNSDQIERLVQGQSVGLAGEVLDEVREQMVTADALVERVVRSLFRRRRRPMSAPPLSGGQS